MLPLQGLRENSGTGFRLLLNPLRGEEKKEEMLSGFLLFLFSAIHTLRLFKNIYVSPNRDSRKKCRNLFIMMEASVLDLRVSVKALFIYRYQYCGRRHRAYGGQEERFTVLFRKKRERKIASLKFKNVT